MWFHELDSCLCLCFLGINEISVDVYKSVEHSDSEDSDKSNSSESEYATDDESKMKPGQDSVPKRELQKESSKSKVKEQPSVSQTSAEKDKADMLVSNATDDSSVIVTNGKAEEKISTDLGKENPAMTEAAPEAPLPKEMFQEKQKETKQMVPTEDSDSEKELVIDLGEEQSGKEKKRSRKDSSIIKESAAGKIEGEKELPLLIACAVIRQLRHSANGLIHFVLLIRPPF